MLNGSGVLLPQLAPPLKEAEAINACAPPFDQRSCCQTAIALPAVTGLTATKGSTSVFGKFVPPAAGAVQLATGLGPEIRNGPLTPSATPAAAKPTTAIAVARMILLMYPPCFADTCR